MSTRQYTALDVTTKDLSHRLITMICGNEPWPSLQQSSQMYNFGGAASGMTPIDRSRYPSFEDPLLEREYAACGARLIALAMRDQFQGI